MFGLNVDRESQVPMTSQLTTQLREALLCGKIPPGQRMPPTRNLAQELTISRNTVIQAYEQLLAEGYLCSAAGSGTFAADIGVLPKLEKPGYASHPIRQANLSTDTIEFRAGNPDLAAFPRGLWAKALKDACLDAETDAFGYGSAGGHIRLRQALCGYLYRTKGIFCDTERIVIVPGTAAGMELVADVLFERGSTVAVEDPGLVFAYHAMTRMGYTVLPVEADNNGMRVEKLPHDAGVKLICVSPSHQYPLGGVLPAVRRIALLEYAQKHNAYIVEDDYDSEFRYHGAPIQSLWHLNDDRVIYMGSFSNVFSPSLRLAYMILPAHLIAKALDMTDELSIRLGAVEQIALAGLMETKEFDRHVYRMKKRYEAKRKHLLNALDASFGSDITVYGENAGFHLLVSYKRNLTGEDFEAFARNGVDADDVESYATAKGAHQNQLVLGYGNLDFEQIDEGVRRLKKSLLENEKR